MTSQDEPAIQVALVNALAKLIVGVAASAGLDIAGLGLAPVLTTAIAAVVAAVWSVGQGYLTRSKVFAPATVEQLVPGSTGDPVLDVPANR